MTKNKRKVIALMMAMVMVMASMFAVTGTTFAGTDENITVTVEFASDSIYECKTVTLDANSGHLYTIPENPGTAVITANTPTIMDATFDALGQIGSTEDFITGWDTVDPRGGMYITAMLGAQTETAADSSATVWRGYAWKYLVNGVESDLYATNVALQNGDVITWMYDFCEEPIN